MKKGPITLALLMTLTLVGCGMRVEQNKFALVIKTLGDRTVETVNVATNGNGTNAVVSDGESDNFTAELITAERAPLQTPGVRVLLFNLGLQSYAFTGRPSIESPENEEFTVDCIDGEVRFDVEVHMYIDPTFPDIKDRLVAFMKAYRLRQYSGSSDVLRELIHGRMRQRLRTPFVEFGANKQALDFIRAKAECNQFALDKMNEEFNQFGLRFEIVAISSMIRVKEGLQRKLNGIVEQSFNNQIIQLRNEEFTPLSSEKQNIEADAITAESRILSQARAAAIDIVAAARKDRITTFTDLVGDTNYVRYELLKELTQNMTDGNMQMTLVPENSTLFMPASDQSMTTMQGINNEGGVK